jgi:hypothetical protein
MALFCSFCSRPVGAVEPPNSPVSVCRSCALEHLPVVLVEGLLTGGADAPGPGGFGADLAAFLEGVRRATRRAVGRLLCPERN